MTFDETNLFTWNDLIVVKSNAPLCYCPEKIAVICGMEQVKSEKLAGEFNVKIGEWIYTLEFGDGSSIEVPEFYLKKYQKLDSSSDQ